MLTFLLEITSLPPVVGRKSTPNTTTPNATRGRRDRIDEARGGNQHLVVDGHEVDRSPQAPPAPGQAAYSSQRRLAHNSLAIPRARFPLHRMPTCRIPAPTTSCSTTK